MRYASSLVGFSLLAWAIVACSGGSGGGAPPLGGKPPPTAPLSIFPVDRRVSHNVGTPAQFPNVAAWGQKVYVAWEDGRFDGRNVYFNRSLDGGATWDPTDVRIDHTFDVLLSAYDVQIACEDDLVVVVWSDDRNGSEDLFVNRSVDGGVTWQMSDTRLDTDVPGAAPSGLPVIALTEGRLYVAWTELRGTTNSIHFSASDDGGASWRVSDVEIDMDGLDAIASWLPVITAQGPNVCVAWRDDRGSPMLGNFAPRSRVSLDGGEHWEPLATINTSPSATVNARQPSLGRSGPQALFAVWQDDRVIGPGGPADNVYCTRSDAAGTGWVSPDTPLTQSTTFMDVGTSAMGFHGPRVGVVWGKHLASPVNHVSLRFRRSLNQGLSWAVEEDNVETSGVLLHSIHGPACACTQDHVFVSWVDDRAGTDKHVRLNHAAWGDGFAVSDVQLDTPVGGTTNLSMTWMATGDGAAYVVWHDDRSGVDAIHMNTARP